MKKNYLLFLKEPNIEARKEAYSLLRKHNIVVLAQYGDTALEVSVTEGNEKTLPDSGFFSEIYEGPIIIENMKNQNDDARKIAAAWNISHEDPHNSMEQSSSKGISWGAEGYDEPRPNTELSEDFFLKSLKEMGVREDEIADLRPKKYKKNEAKADVLKLEEELNLKIKDPTRVYHLSRLAIIHPELEKIILNLDEKEVEGLFNKSKVYKTNLGADIAGGMEEGCWKMNGKISIGIVFVESSKTDGPVFSATDRSTLRSEIQKGLNWLATQHPSGNLSWVYDYQYLSLNIDNGDMKSKEDYWRNPAMQAVRYGGKSYTGDWSGVANYRNEMRTKNDSSHAIVAFVTPFGTDWHAYASNGRLTICNRNNYGGWGINNINTIAAHEISHLFGAADEYVGSGTPCTSCTTTHGCDNVVNGNCKACAKDGGVPCIMDQNTLTICAYTKKQIGWPVSLPWNRFQLAPYHMASQSGRVAMVSRIPNSMEIFWIGADGSVWDAYWYEGMKQWNRFEIAPPGSASINGSITAVSRIPTSMEIFWIGADGSVWDAYWYEGMNQWNRFQIAPSGMASIDGDITAVSRISNSMEIFWIGGDGSVWDAYWYEGMNQWNRFQIAPPAMASQSGGITVLSRIPNSMEIFWIGGDGSVWDAYWYEGMAQWNRFQIAPPDGASRFGGIAAVSRISNSMEIFWIGGDGSVWDAYWYEGMAEWNRFQIAPPNGASRFGGISAVSRISNSMEIFWIGGDGSVWDAYWYEGMNNWNRFQIAPPDGASRFGRLASVSRLSNSMEIFWIGGDGTIWDAYWYA